MPTPTMSVSNGSVCESGNNSDVVTVTTTGTSNGGTLVYTVNNGGTVDGSTGSFDPTANAAGKTYTITLTYTDANGCVSTATDDVTVHALPTVSITAPAEICYNGMATMITATVDPAGGTGVWEGTASSTDASFDPSTKTTGANAIKYTYTDTYKCQNVAHASTDVVKVNAPEVGPTQTVLITSGSLSGSDLLTATATTAGDVLE